MIAVQLEANQVLDFVRQLAPEKQAELLRTLLTSAWPGWAAGASYAEQRARAAAKKRGRDWDRMSEAERETFINDVLQEGSLLAR
jgi:hypothetical protein